MASGNEKCDWDGSTPRVWGAVEFTENVNQPPRVYVHFLAGGNIAALWPCIVALCLALCALRLCCCPAFLFGLFRCCAFRQSLANQGFFEKIKNFAKMY